MERNELYPVFLKVSNLHILIVGGGNVALEKLTFLLKSSPTAQVEMVSPMFREETIALANKFNIKMNVAPYDVSYLKDKNIAIATTDNVPVNEQVYHDCRERQILVNVADNPPFCDFYMGGIVTKGNVKIAISTNGKSPTTAKRLRQFFEDVIPENIDDLVKNLNEFRKTIKGDFEEKVETLNEFTKGLVNKKED
ncbi:bifunctional precorrin-2 dehydrogenase/sirohydrochlorin ferrochelatase [Maribacter sp. SA7]|uniref:precorrin-2 dehydrogenase/sirohydrochlorin ferrochelatase family protein n=1 Tax=Maribacter zhoushanensis TaxID=3030012 RepID=UPI0023ED6327|nr:bifunctional precorrin-2 dehydrogenase/sirohydrochlorin ferrochelatase [Maribacter zhoushanensis]MDF4201386.1 bifunctional precorrin-2 dehydrogenase/sirohydrochlorin ferrochelatase [Maribacter zhoushanensis]